MKKYVISPTCLVEVWKGLRYLGRSLSVATEYFFLFIMNNVFGSLVAVFVIKGLDWTVQRGAVITSIFYGALGICRLLGVPLSYVVSPRFMLNTCLLSVCAAYILMMFVPSLGDTAMFVSVAAAGFSVSTVYGSMFLFAAQYIMVTGFVSGVCLSGGCLGMMVGFYLVGYPLENVGHMWMVYVLFFASSSNLILFIFAQFYTAKVFYRRKKVGLHDGNCSARENNK